MSDPAPPTLPTVEDIRSAAERIAGQAVRTPLLSSPILDETVGRRVALKCENLQRTGSFKFRGAYNAISRLGDDQRQAGVVAVSSGNHAQGVAEAARILGVRATIVMPTDAPSVKRSRTERSGGRVVTFDRASEDREAVAARFMAEHGGVLIHPYDHPDVIAGQGTVGLEIAADCAALGLVPDAVVMPCGGGGLSAGVALAIGDALPKARTIIVEPDGFDIFGRSLHAGHAITTGPTAGSVCDALMAPYPGARAFAIHRRRGTAALSVGDEEALAAVAFAFRELKLVVEPGGAVALAALLSRRREIEGDTVVVVLSGGNIDEAMLVQALG